MLRPQKGILDVQFNDTLLNFVPPHKWKRNTRNYKKHSRPAYPNYRLFFRETPPPLCVYLCAWYTTQVSIPFKSLVLTLIVLAFITLSDLYYPHHPPSEGCTFRSQKKSILYSFSPPLPLHSCQKQGKWKHIKYNPDRLWHHAL